MMYVKHFVTCKALCTHVGDCSHYAHYYVTVAGWGAPEGISMVSGWGCSQRGLAWGLPEVPARTVAKTTGRITWALDLQGCPEAHEHHGFDHLCSGVPLGRIPLHL